jgi:hypothetical protein
MQEREVTVGSEKAEESTIIPQVTLKKTEVFVTDPSEVLPEMFIESIEGTSDYRIGFRNTVFQRDEIQVCEAFLEELTSGQSKVDIKGTLCSYEARVESSERLTEIPELDADGQYLTELVVADVSGGASVWEVIIFLDRNLPDTQDMTAEAPASTMTEREMAVQVFELVNERRQSEGLTTLVWDETMCAVANERAQEIVHQFSHERPDGVSVIDSLYAAGYVSGCGENIARYGNHASDVVDGWMNSVSHRENIMEPRFTHGVAACICVEGVYYWVSLFRA